MENISVIQMAAQNVPDPTNVKIRGRDYVNWGVDNNYPKFLKSLYDGCAEHQAIIDNLVVYIIGNGVATANPNLKQRFDYANRKGDTINTVLYNFLLDVKIYGGGCIQRMYNAFGELTEIYHMDISRCRFDDKETTCYYSKNWENYRPDAVEIQVNKTTKDEKTDVFYYKGKKTRDVYPVAEYNAAITSIQTLIEVNNFHLNNVSNGFAPSTIVQFNNGEPTEPDKKRIEKKFSDKFAGTNGQKHILIWNESKEKQAVIEKLDADNFGDQYDTLYKNAQNTVFVAHKVTSPALFGVKMEGTGFSKTEFEEAFDIFNKTVIASEQKTLINIIENIFEATFGKALGLTINPFTLV